MEIWLPKIKVFMTRVIENDGMDTEIFPFCSYSLKKKKSHLNRRSEEQRCSKWKVLMISIPWELNVQIIQSSVNRWKVVVLISSLSMEPEHVTEGSSHDINKPPPTLEVTVR